MVTRVLGSFHFPLTGQNHLGEMSLVVVQMVWFGYLHVDSPPVSYVPSRGWEFRLSPVCICLQYIMGLQFSGLKLRLIDICRKLVLLLNVWKYSVFWASAFKICKKFFFLWSLKNAKFYADFKFVEIGSRNVSEIFLFLEGVVAKCHSFFSFSALHIAQCTLHR